MNEAFMVCCASNRKKSKLNLIKMKLAAVLKICENTDDMSFEKNCQLIISVGERTTRCWRHLRLRVDIF